MPDFLGWCRRLLGIKNEADLEKDLDKDPAVRRAKRAVRIAEETLDEIEAMERLQAREDRRRP